MIFSFSAKVYRQETAYAESVFHSLKIEANYGKRSTFRKGVRQAICKYVEVD